GGVAGLRQILLRALALGAVAGDGEKADAASVRVTLERDRLLDDDDRPVLARDRVLERPDRLAGQVDLRVHRAQDAFPFGGGALAEVAAENLALLEAVEAAERVVHEQIVAAQIDDAAAVLHLIEDGAIADAAGAERPLGARVR